MKSLARLIISVSALIASLSCAWLALSLTHTIPGQHVTVYHRFDHSGGLGLSLDRSGSVSLDHSGLIDHGGSVEITH